LVIAVTSPATLLANPIVPHKQAQLNKLPLAVADLAEHLDPPSRLMLVRRLVREGLLESVAPL